MVPQYSGSHVCTVKTPRKLLKKLNNPLKKDILEGIFGS